jgi:hypothetical protein
MTKHEVFKDLMVGITPTGSRHICNPPPMNTDDDYLVCCRDKAHREEVVKRLLENGFEHDAGESYDGRELDGMFSSFRKGELNYIVTDDHEFARRHFHATHICRELNLKEKHDRIMVFRAFLYGELIPGTIALAAP